MLLIALQSTWAAGQIAHTPAAAADASITRMALRRVLLGSCTVLGTKGWPSKKLPGQLNKKTASELLDSCYSQVEMNLAPSTTLSFQ